MSDLHKVTNLAEQKRRASEEVLAASQERESKYTEEQKQLFLRIFARVKFFAEQLRGTVGVYISTISSENTVVVSVSSISPWIRRPFCRIKISPGWSAERYSCLIKMHDKDETSSASLSFEEVEMALSEIAADFLSKRTGLSYEIPYWYTATGDIISWPLFALAWLVLIFSGGIWGVFLGWIPSLILRYLAKYLWCPCLIYLALNPLGW